MVEGIRAQVIDKDRNPHWSPTTLEQVSDDMVRGYFAPVANPPFPDVEEIPMPMSLREARR